MWTNYTDRIRDSRGHREAVSRRWRYLWLGPAHFSASVWGLTFWSSATADQPTDYQHPSTALPTTRHASQTVPSGTPSLVQPYKKRQGSPELAVSHTHDYGLAFQNRLRDRGSVPALPRARRQWRGKSRAWYSCKQARRPRPNP
jgi:hypothetical protein